MLSIVLKFIYLTWSVIVKRLSSLLKALQALKLKDLMAHDFHQGYIQIETLLDSHEILGPTFP